MRDVRVGLIKLPMAISPTERNAELGKFFQALKDRVLEPDDPAYIANVHQDSIGGDPIEDLASQILWNEGGGTYLFTGQRGTGKSTELRRLRQKLEYEGCIVFLLDMSDYISETEPIEIGDFLVSLMGALSDAVEIKHGRDPAHRSYWERTRDFLLTEVKVEEFSLRDFKFSLKEDPKFKERIQAAARGRLAAMIREARAFVGELLRRINPDDRRFVVIADSVERLRGVNAEGARKVFDSAVALFSGNPDNLRFPPMHVVYTVPPYLSALTANLSALYSSTLVSLASMHIFESPDGTGSRRPSDDGLNAMRRMIEVRYPRWVEVIGEAELRELARSSGGDIRDYFRLVGNALVKARSPSIQLPLETAVIAVAKDAMRREMLPIPDEHKDWLKRIATHKDCQLESESRLATLAGFLDTRRVLNYRNGRDWYDVHPLLWELIDAHEPRTADGTVHDG